MTLGLAMAASVLLAACGDSEEKGEPSAERRAPITVKHALGTTRVPADPQRIVVTNPYSLLDYLLAMGIKPVGSSGDEGAQTPFASWLKDKAEGIAVVGGIDGMNLERLTAVKPDLILADPWRTEEYKQLSKIAPTVGVPLDYVDYEKEFRYVARLVGREAAAGKLIDAHRERLAEFDRAMGDRDPLISVARVLAENNKIEGQSYVPTLLWRAGLRRPPAHEKKADGIEFSLEELRLVDGDELFIYSGSIAAEQEANDKALKRLQRHPLWDRLEAVRNDNVHLVDANLWGGGGLLWAEAMVDELRRYLVDDTG